MTTTTDTTNDTATCPYCEADVDVPGDARVTSVIVCSGCDAELEVVGLAPVELALAPEIEEDFGE